MSTDTTPRLDVQLYRVTDAVRMLNLSRTAVFELLRSGRLRSVKQGRTRLIPASAIRDYITLLEHEAEALAKRRGSVRVFALLRDPAG
jgi:excisionase family DNA binding protein